MHSTRGSRLRAIAAGGLLAAFGMSACGDDDFANEPRPPVALAISGVVTEDRVTISPRSFGAGPVVLTVSNQTPRSHRISLEGTGDDGTKINEITGPVNPRDTATIQQTLPEGEYQVSANSDGARISSIEPDTITVGPPRSDASDELELP